MTEIPLAIKGENIGNAPPVSLLQFPEATGNKRVSLRAEEIEALVDQSISGDSGSFAELYGLYRESIFRYSYSRTSNVENAQDITQQVFLNAWRGIGGYQRIMGRPFEAWLFTISHNVTVGYYRDHSRRPVAYLDEKIPSPEVDPGEIAVQQERNLTLMEAISRLIPSQQQVISLRFFDNLGFKEIGEIMGKSPVAVRVLKRRAISSLKRDLNRDDF